ncbi:P22 phage major capsid protein family protein [Limnoglobus roseus]|uniref:Uncharacterized protein n=1 Tax=Limnoglobus roseus TaxID=2598579 RepID=A0A5C1AMX3_9BACT|nr:P22 phage major capsid protein family protein [Limnoglobus roseus]QEL19336.1 hypothetical protein PX52LOC_06405 [Limnoglobus roseus]
MANTFNAVDLIASESLRIFSNELYFLKNMNTDYQSKFQMEVEDHRTGPTVRIQKPARRTVRQGWTRSPQDFTEESTSLTIDTVRGDDMNIPEAELALLVQDPESNMAGFSKRFLQTRMTTLANSIDAEQFAKMYVLVGNAVGTPGQTPNTWGPYGDAMQKLDENLCPAADRMVIINPAARNKTADAFKGLALQQLSEKALSRAYLGSIADFDVFMSQNVPNHTVGPLGGTPLVNTGSQVGSSLVTDGWTAAAASRLKKGDIFTIAGVYQVNYQTKAQYSSLQQFLVTADVSSDGSGNLTAAIFPSIITSGATQTVNASPADNAAITVVGTAATLYAQNLAYHKDAFTVAFAKLSSPKVSVESSTKTFENISMRYMRGYDIANAQLVDRIDVFLGSNALYREWACRIFGA